ncbi:MAG: flavin prenyltransferase UbiX [Chloroflexota bacterium]|nr:flavin prenyltransferase UbiX [Chloroflexota bacterium]
MQRIIVAITGASGSVYAVRLLKILLEQPREVHLIVSEWGERVTEHELGYDVNRLEEFVVGQKAKLIRHDNDDLFAAPASGSFEHDGMVIVPCSMRTLGSVASGIAASLIERAADVCLKERRPLILVPRETPLSAIHIQNMLRVTEAGAIVLPPSPAFYTQPQSVDDLIDFIVSRILNQLGIEHNLTGEWNGK